MDGCYECGERGHKKANCPRIQCRRCHQRGHMARDCQWSGRQDRERQSRSHTRDSSHQRFNSSRPPPSSNAHKIPSHWQLSEEYDSLTSAVTGLWKEYRKFRINPADWNEHTEIEQLIKKTWNEDVVGHGADARNLSHSNVEMVKVERVENPELYERYSEKKQKLLRRLRDPDLGDAAFSRVDRLPGSSGPVLTTQSLPFDSILRRNIYPKINEHYLFHGTKEDYVSIIARDGMDNRFGSRRSLLGPGLYTAESCTKADQYTDNKSGRTDELLKMFLVRVLLGEPYVSTDKNPPKFQRPPCRSCQQILCDCPHTVHYDSVLDDAGRLFREFVVYEQSQCYPEYIITYRRVWGSADDSFLPYCSASSSMSAFSSSCLPLVKIGLSSANNRSSRSLAKLQAEVKVTSRSKSVGSRAKSRQNVVIRSPPVHANDSTLNLAVAIPHSTPISPYSIPAQQPVQPKMPNDKQSYPLQGDRSGDGKSKTSSAYASQPSEHTQEPDRKSTSGLPKAIPAKRDAECAVTSTTTKSASSKVQAAATAAALSLLVASLRKASSIAPSKATTMAAEPVTLVSPASAKSSPATTKDIKGLETKIEEKHVLHSKPPASTENAATALVGRRLLLKAATFKAEKTDVEITQSQSKQELLLEEIDKIRRQMRSRRDQTQ